MYFLGYQEKIFYGWKKDFPHIFLHAPFIFQWSSRICHALFCHQTNAYITKVRRTTIKTSFVRHKSTNTSLFPHVFLFSLYQSCKDYRCLEKLTFCVQNWLRNENLLFAMSDISEHPMQNKHDKLLVYPGSPLLHES